MKKSNISENESLLVFRSNSWVLNIAVCVFFLTEAWFFLSLDDVDVFFSDRLFPENNLSSILYFLFAAVGFIYVNWYFYLLLNYTFYRPFVEFSRTDDSITLLKNGEVMEKRYTEEISEVSFMDRVNQFELRISLKTGKITDYYIAEGYLWGVLFRKSRRREHRRKIKNIFSGMNVKEYRNGKYLKI